MTEAFFQDQLDAAPDDSSCRLLLADWLNERGDPDAAGYRWMAENHKCPYVASATAWVIWISDLSLWAGRDTRFLCCYLPLGILSSKAAAHGYSTRRDAEAALCRAVATLENSSQD